MGRERTVDLALFFMLPVTVLVAWLMGEIFTITLATRIAILAIAATGLNLALGHGGLVSFGHAAFFGAGGYVCGILASHAFTNAPLMTAPFLIEGTKSMPVIWLVAIIVSAALAALIGLFALRTAGVYFIMLTLAFAQMIYYFAISFPGYGGEDGLPTYVRNGFPGLNTLDPMQFFWLCFAVLALTIWLVDRFTWSRFGLALAAARQNGERLEAVGIAPFRIRYVAFIVSGAITGLAGALYTDLNRFVSPSMLSWQTSGELIVFIILGGTARLFGPLLGAALFVVLENTIGGWTEHWPFFVGAILLLVVLFARGGAIAALSGKAVDHG
ncbi:MAG: branched-chain amino acid ABC transporter permease [Pseudomonadota bacterium]